MTRKLFIDCGGYDGCSAIKFLSTHPEFECITFEPNSALGAYYRGIPTRLERSAVSTFDGTVRLLVDPIDGDGSTIIAGKKVDATGSLTNLECPEQLVPCTDLDEFIRKHTSKDDYVALKLDIEGAEYDVLERMMNSGTIARISDLFVEFHWDRAGIPRERHEALLYELERRYGIVPKDWDAADFAVHRRGACAHVKRSILLFRIAIRRFLIRFGWQSSR